jgi:hypothetical protein
MRAARLALGWMVLEAVLPARAALFGRFRSPTGNRASAIALRKRLHVNTLITEPGTMELEWGGAFSTAGSTAGNFSFPSAIKYTPEGTHPWWGRTEFSASFDSLSSLVQFDNRTTQFSDRLTLAANCVVHDGDRFDLAIAPQASFLLRGDEGQRFGATAIARYDWGRNSAGATLTWTAATASSATNPAGTFDVGAGYGRRLKASGPLGHLTPHANWLYERSTGVGRTVSLFEGVEYQVTERVAVDFSGQHFSVWGGPVDHQVSVGLTVNTGRLRHPSQ